MSIKVLVVDDSSFFRRRVSEIINSHAEMSVLDTAVNGKEAVEKAKSLSPDVITMDVEMPVMDGITAVKEIMKDSPVPIIMFSSLTHEGAQATLDALEAGALDFLPKKFEDIARDKKEATELLQERVRAVARRKSFMRSSPAPRTRSAKPAAPAAKESAAPKRAKSTAPSRRMDFKLLAIGTSTGGPVALQKILTQLPENFKTPILLIQHMPAAFTPTFAVRMNSLCKINVKEAEQGDVLAPGTAYLAPGGKQMFLDSSSSPPKLVIKEDNTGKVTYKPSVDITFGSVAKIYKDKVLAVVLTGMGADGREGARLLKQHGSKVLAQDEQSCVVYGMPQAVVTAGLAEDPIALDDMAERILNEMGHG
ncbi:protein-glutamate methylesterase/protein-glutamine glutaminase [Algicola sagamiensis]|uniref:protein-glutamate methylesterase/protein-glutamine glutaminase n=1 Tax=Algicola sagamiensis TaxID=163869 RepID=UPI000362EBE6|nr:chemotaxis response regulator protein-glutamate methylesterase [Algicola sagamiensis]